MYDVINFIQVLLSKVFPYKPPCVYDIYVTSARRGRNWDDIKKMEK